MSSIRTCAATPSVASSVTKRPCVRSTPTSSTATPEASTAGPRSDSPGNDQTGCSLAGVTYEDGGCHDGGRPFWSLTSLGDTGNGFFSAIGVIQALYHRQRTGEAQSVDTSILNAGMLLASMAALKPDGTASAPAAARPDAARAQPPLPPVRGQRRVDVPRRDHCRAPAGAPDRDRNRHARRRPPRTVVPDRTAAEVFTELDQAGVPCEICDENFGARVHDDPEMHAHDLVVVQHHPKLGRFEHFGDDHPLLRHPGTHLGSAARLRPTHAPDHARARL